jgi:hypothetical protein
MSAHHKKRVYLRVKACKRLFRLVDDVHVQKLVFYVVFGQEIQHSLRVFFWNQEASSSETFAAAFLDESRVPMLTYGFSKQLIVNPLLDMLR